MLACAAMVVSNGCGGELDELGQAGQASVRSDYFWTYDRSDYGDLNPGLCGGEPKRPRNPAAAT